MRLIRVLKSPLTQLSRRNGGSVWICGLKYIPFFLFRFYRVCVFWNWFCRKYCLGYMVVLRYHHIYSTEGFINARFLNKKRNSLYMYKLNSNTNVFIHLFPFRRENINKLKKKNEKKQFHYIFTRWIHQFHNKIYIYFYISMFFICCFFLR